MAITMNNGKKIFYTLLLRIMILSTVALECITAEISSQQLPVELWQEIYTFKIDSTQIAGKLVNEHYSNLILLQEINKCYLRSLFQQATVNKAFAKIIPPIIKKSYIPTLTENLHKRLRVRTVTITELIATQKKLETDYNITASLNSMQLAYIPLPFLSALLGAGPWINYTRSILQTSPAMSAMYQQSLLVYLTYCLNQLDSENLIRILLHRSKNNIYSTTILSYELLVSTLENLLSAGLDANFGNAQTSPLLWQATEKGKYEMVRALLRAGANVNARYNQKTLFDELFNQLSILYEQVTTAYKKQLSSFLSLTYRRYQKELEEFKKLVYVFKTEHPEWYQNYTKNPAFIQRLKYIEDYLQARLAYYQARDKQ